MATIGIRLKKIRIQQGLNQKAVANIAGVTNAAVSKWETNGGEPRSAVVAMRLAQRLQVNPIWFVCGSGDPNDVLHVPDLSDDAQNLARRIDRLPDSLRTAVASLLDAIRR